MLHYKNFDRRQVTFSEEIRNGLLKKANNLSFLCDAILSDIVPLACEFLFYPYPMMYVINFRSYTQFNELIPF